MELFGNLHKTGFCFGQNGCSLAQVEKLVQNFTGKPCFEKMNTMA